ncbi:hypothetical protein ACIA5G_50960 [Amycolatopsis sp. NPDC051758]|uniref:hypothetical protein n=1 Tax=Amycolatopsis sp. NPDC051758 TaxID=3363935 RepID=UPI0037AE6BC1
MSATTTDEEHADSGPGARGRRSWDALSHGDRRVLEVLLEHADFGRAAEAAGRADRNFTLWLLDASLAFADLTNALPQDLTDETWRSSYAEGVTPWVAARVALHRAPSAVIDGGHLVCSVCQTAGEIFERDVAVRYHPLLVEDGDVYAALDDIDFVHDQYACDHCGTRVHLPREVED